MSKIHSYSYIYITIVFTIVVCLYSINNFAQIASDKHLFIDVYPNPVRGTVNVSLFGLYSIPAASGKLELFDVQGKSVKDMSNEYQKNANKNWSIFTSDFSSVAAGVYVLSFRSGSRRVSKRLLVIK